MPVKSEINLLHCRPERSLGSEPEGERMVILRPRFMRGPFAWWLQPHLKRPFFRVRLDDIGSFIWNLCDGQTTVSQIAAAMDSQFGQRVSPAIDRLALFLRQLEDGNMINMHLPEEEH